jgi:hypothetical protein
MIVFDCAEAGLKPARALIGVRAWRNVLQV